MASLCAVLVITTVTSSTVAEEESDMKGELIIFHAGSLAVPFEQIAEAFMEEYPEVKVLREAAGSRACARKISDLGRDCDVMASADYTVINNLLIPNHAEWCIRFACNEMVIAYHEGSRQSERINSENWYEILLDPEVAFGRSDPNADPCGYRSVMVCKLAEKHYTEPGLAEKLLQKDRRHIRPKETDLLALLETGTIDYIFLYRSVTEQHGLKFVTLPAPINLKSEKFADLYSTAKVEVTGKKPGEKIVQQGSPIVYGVTIPKTAKNPQAALAFVRFLLDKDKGLAIMKRNGQPPVVPEVSLTYEKIPSELITFAKPPEKEEKKTEKDSP